MSKSSTSIVSKTEAESATSESTSESSCPLPKRRRTDDTDQAGPNQQGETRRSYAGRFPLCIKYQSPCNKRRYAGTSPKCARCKHHHVVNQLCKKCTICGMMGHKSQNCWTLTTERPDSLESIYLPYSNVKRCYTCGEPGHVAKKCPKRV
ncbi:hypothetical protein R6Q57_018537 [Mikania cordata]